MIFEQRDNETWVRPVIKHFPPSRCNDLSEQVDGELRKLIDSCNQKHVVSWGWFAVPIEDADMDDLLDQMTEIFTEAGSFDRDRCNEIHSVRAESEKAYEYEAVS